MSAPAGNGTGALNGHETDTRPLVTEPPAENMDTAVRNSHEPDAVQTSGVQDPDGPTVIRNSAEPIDGEQPVDEAFDISDTPGTFDTSNTSDMSDTPNTSDTLGAPDISAAPDTPAASDEEIDEAVVDTSAFDLRFDYAYDELRNIYRSLYYGNEAAFSYFCEVLKRNWLERKEPLRELDEQRRNNLDWYYSNDILGMALYTQAFAGTLQGVREKIPYFQELGVNYLHLMPLLVSPRGESDGGYAVSDFRTVQPELGTMDDLEELCDTCREQKIDVCLDFVLNHTSEQHEWAKAARAGDPVARARYFFYDNWYIPTQYEAHMPQVFPITAPGNFTYLPDCGQVVMTTFHHYQWDLNYANPMVLNDMIDNMLYLINRGVTIIRLDAIPYIWKQLGTNCRNLPQVHTLTRLLRLVCQVVCPSVLLLGEVVMEPSKVTPYFGGPGAPECNMLYNVTTMGTTWHSLATRDVKLLRREVEKCASLGTGCLFLNYLRCHDDIGWGLDYAYLREFGMEEAAHKKYLNDWFTGLYPGSNSRGELYNDDPRIRDARLCGTTASLCGLEVAEQAGNDDFLARSIQCDIMLHAWLFTISGIPVIYSGDELAQINDYGYHEDPEKWDDSRYLHRGNFDWDAAEKRDDPSTVPGKVFQSVKGLAALRAQEKVFRADAKVEVIGTFSDSVLIVKRTYGDELLYAYFNFSEWYQQVQVPEGLYHDLFYSVDYPSGSLTMPPFGFMWLKPVPSEPEEDSER